MALEDFTTYTQVGPQPTTVTANTLLGAPTRNATHYIYKDFGVDFFGTADWELQWHFDVTSAADGSICYSLVLTDELNSMDQQFSGADHHIDFLVNRTSGGTNNAHLREWDGTTANDDIFTPFALNTTYYVTMAHSSGVITLTVYSNAARTTVVDTLTITLNVNPSFRYILLFVSNNTGSGQVMGLEMFNLEDTSTAPVEIRTSRTSLEVLTLATVPKVVPLPLGDDAHVFLHNWLSGAQMTSAFKTDVTHSPDTGAESRRGLANKPARTMKFWWLPGDGADLDEIERLEVLLRRMTDARFQVPIYMDQQTLAVSRASADTTLAIDTTEGRWFKGARVVVVQPGGAFSFHLIDSLTTTVLTLEAALGVDVVSGSLVMPVLDCEIILKTSPKLHSAQVPELQMTVSEVGGPSQLPVVATGTPASASEFESRPIWFEEPDWRAGIVKGRSRQGKRIRKGRADFIAAHADRSRQLHKFALSGNRSDMWKVVQFFDSREGRLRSFWLIDQDQYMGASSIDASGNYIEVTEVGDISDFDEEMGHVGVIMADGTVYVREVSSTSDQGATSRINFATAIGTSLDVADVHRVARARLTRFDADVLVETWNSLNHMSCSLNFIEVLDEATYAL